MYIVSSVTNIGSAAFSGCNKLTSITIPNGVASIKNSTFFECSYLTSIQIPKSVTSIGYLSFDGCNSLTSINFGGTKEQWNSIDKDDAWDSDTGNYTVTCTDGTIAKY